MSTVKCHIEQTVECYLTRRSPLAKKRSVNLNNLVCRHPFEELGICNKFGNSLSIRCQKFGQRRVAKKQKYKELE